MKTLIFLAIFTLNLVLIPAHAHSKLVLTNPGDGAELEDAPEQLMLEFNREVRLLKLHITDGDEEQIKLAFKATAAKQTTFEQALPELEAGTYQVSWMAMSRDTHKIKGNFSFTLSPTESND